MESLKEAVALRASDLGFTVFDFFDLKEEFEIVPVLTTWLTSSLRSSLGIIIINLIRSIIPPVRCSRLDAYVSLVGEGV